MLLVVYLISFFLFCHQTGQYIVRITERTTLHLSTNILTCIFLCDILVTVRTQDSFRTRIYREKYDYSGWVK